MSGIEIRALEEDDRDWARHLIETCWGSTIVVSRSHAHHPDRLPGFVAMFGEKRVGLITYRVDGDGCEIITLNSLMERIGIGTALVKAVQSKAASSNWRRLWLITTNDNLQALSFYQRRGFSLAALHRNAVDLSRKLKPEIPQIGFNGIPIRDELELEMLL